MAKRNLTILLAMIPVFVALWVWFSALSFVPVPWPDDSAFYFVAREFFKWPPRWVMLPQAPFEPTYRIYNFNTMPLYPLLIGLGRFIGIDGSWGIKFWPLLGWALSGSLLVSTLFKKGLSFPLTLLVALAVSLDPELRWASVLVRPESLIGFFGLALVLGLTLGFPTRFRARGLWDPIAALLALGAYAHFNAVHLLFPVIAAFALNPRRWISIALRTTLYLSPWILTVALHPALFVHQMQTQWTRLAVPNPWLKSPSSALAGLFQGMGSPDPWPDYIKWAALGIWILILLALIIGIAFPISRLVRGKTQDPLKEKPLSLLPAGAWVVGSIWLWHTKPEVWFVYYIHLAVWCFTGLLLLKIFLQKRPSLKSLAPLSSLVALLVIIFGTIDVSQGNRLAASPTWHWSMYYSFVDCIDQRLIELEKNLGTPRPFQVWGPTFPDVTIELSRRHPDWEFSRTNDFWDRAPLAIQHGRDVQAMVVTETLGWTERDISAPAGDYPEIHSQWMTWDAYYLNRLWREKGWKPNRYLCQRGRWQAFMFMAAEPTAPTPPPATH